jgi:cellulose synthase/poly-beta-1,6-N-acetylglucosamine synthase-like glycosyltransferase
MITMDLGLLCEEGMKSIDCARMISPNLKGIFIFLWTLLLLIFATRWILTGKKIKTKGKVFWVGIILTDVIVLVLVALIYFLLPWLMSTFGIV